MIELINVTKIFDDKIILDKLNININKGKFYSIIGLSGCGKTTILKLIAGLEQPNNGKIILKSNKIGYMSQKDLLLGWLNITKNILLPLKLKKQNFDKKKFKQLMEDFNIWQIKDKMPHQISGGQKQRASLLRTFYIGGDILLLDEPFAAIDMLTKYKLYQWLKTIIYKLNLTVIYVTHDIDEAIFLSDKTIVLGTNGKILKTIDYSNINKEKKNNQIKTIFYKLIENDFHKPLN